MHFFHPFILLGKENTILSFFIEIQSIFTRIYRTIVWIDITLTNLQIFTKNTKFLQKNYPTHAKKHAIPDEK